MADGTPLEKLREMREMTSRLATIGAAVTTEDQVITLLGSLPPRYDPLVMTLGVKMHGLTLADIESCLRDEDMRKGRAGRAAHAPEGHQGGRSHPPG